MSNSAFSPVGNSRLEVQCCVVACMVTVGAIASVIYNKASPNPEIECLDHTLIVREYTRSSADKIEPLPYELRTVAALKLTMDYLLCNIIDQESTCNSMLSEWYNFLWNRTRAIRNDIYQQQLSCLTSVDIIEKCARFHVHCASSLCEEEVNIFDPKINYENLMKCLKSLKFMYDDLAEENIHCPNEPEFRAYDILLCLKEGDVLKHVLKLRINVRNHPDIQFAVNAALAYTSNNFFRFFKLVESTTYLNACLLHRYFSEVRTQALKIMLRAFTPMNKPELYPLKELGFMLKLEGVIETSQFVQMLGLKIKDEFVVLDRTAFLKQNGQLTMAKSAIIENKRQVTVSQIINRGPLPTNPLFTYKPHNSFDDQGYLKKEAYEAVDQNINQTKDMDEQAETAAATLSDVIPSRPLIFLSNRNIPPTLTNQQSFTFNIVSPSAPIHDIDLVEPTLPEIGQLVPDQPLEIIESVVPFQMEKEDVEEAFNTAEELIQMENKEEKIKQKTAELYEIVFNGALSYVLRKISTEVLLLERENEKKQIKEQQRKEAFFKKIVAYAIDKVARRVLNYVIQNEIRGYIREERVKINEEKKIADLKRKITLFIENMIHKEIIVLAKEVLDKEKRKFASHVEEAKQYLEMRRARKALLLWRKNALSKRTLEASKNLFPSGPPDSRVTTIKLSSHVNPMWNLSSSERLTRILDAGVFYKLIREEISWSPLDLIPLFQNTFHKGITLPQLALKTYYWKLLLLYDQDNESSAYALFTQWLQAKFTKGNAKQDCSKGSRVCSLYWLTNDAGNRIAICVRSIPVGIHYKDTLQEMQQKSLLEGTNAVLICLQKANIAESKVIELWEDALSKILQPCWNVPVHFLIFNNGVTLPSYVNFFMAGFRDKHHPSHQYKVDVLNFSQDLFNATKMLEDAVQWLLMNIPPFPGLAMDYQQNFIDNCIRCIFSIIYEDLAVRKIHLDPQILISFFNKTIRIFVTVLATDSICKLSWPLPEMVEFCDIDETMYMWASTKPKKNALKWISDFTMPKFDGNPNDVKTVFQYVNRIQSTFKIEFCNVIPRITYLLQNNGKYDDSAEIPWTNILHECVMFACSAFNFLDAGISSKKNVVYSQEEMNKINLWDVWHQTLLKFSPIKKRKLPFEDEENKKLKFRKTENAALEQESEVVQQIEGFSLHTLNDSTPSDTIQSHLERNLALEKQESDSYLARLQKCVNFISDENQPDTGNNETEVVEITQKMDMSQKMQLLKDNLEAESKADELLLKKWKLLLF